MHHTKLGFGLLLGLSSICLGANTSVASADVAGQKAFYQDALSRFDSLTDCDAATLMVSMGRSELHNHGQPPWSSEAIYVQYVAQTRCEGPHIKTTIGTASIEEPLDLDPRFESGLVEVDVEVQGFDCLETENGSECADRTFSFVATVAWTGVGEITHVEESYKDPQNGIILSKYERDERQAEASFAGVVDGHVFDLNANEASMQRVVEHNLYRSKP